MAGTPHQQQLHCEVGSAGRQRGSFPARRVGRVAIRNMGRMGRCMFEHVCQAGRAVYVCIYMYIMCVSCVCLGARGWEGRGG